MPSLSEWDTLAVDESGRPSNGASDPSPASLAVDVHENYLTLHTTEASQWNPLSLFLRPQMGVIRGGDLTLVDIHVLTERAGDDPTSGFLWATWFERGADVIATVGVVAHGFSPTGRYVGVTASDTGRLSNALVKWAAAGRLPAQLGKLGFANALRYNQGDAFFAKQMGHPLSATPVGEAKLPLLYHSDPRFAEQVSLHVPSQSEIATATKPPRSRKKKV